MNKSELTKNLKSSPIYNMSQILVKIQNCIYEFVKY